MVLHQMALIIFTLIVYECGTKQTIIRCKNITMMYKFILNVFAKQMQEKATQTNGAQWIIHLTNVKRVLIIKLP